MILSILKTFIFLLSFYGISQLIKEKIKIKKEFSYAFSSIIITSILLFSAILNILMPITYLLHLLGIGSVIYNIIKRKKEFFDFNYKDLVIFIFLIYLMVLGLTSKFTSYDNFSHWALIVKQLFVHNSLPSFEYNLVDFTTYPPASALFIYYFGSIAGKVETSMIVGQLYFTFIFLTPLTVFLKNDRKAVSIIVFIVFSLFVLNSNIPLADLLVDTTLGTLGVFSCCVAYIYRKNLKKAFKLLTIISCGFIILKNSGVLFAAFNALLLLLIGVHNKDFKKGIRYSVISLLIAFSILFLWQQHLRLVYPGNTGITTKHSISITNFGRTIIKNGIENSKRIAIKYYSNIFNIKDIILRYLIEINLFLMIGMLLSKKYKEHLKIITFINVLYFTYWFCLGLMYILSMPYEEAIRLACYGRYMMSVIIILFGITFISIFELHFKKNLKSNIYIIISILSMLILIFTNPFNSYKQLFNFNNNEVTEVDKLKLVVKDYPIDQYEDKNVHINLNCSFYTYTYHILKYEYFSKNFSLSCGDLNVEELGNNTIIIVPDGNKDLSNQQSIFKLKNNVYEIIR